MNSRQAGELGKSSYRVTWRLINYFSRPAEANTFYSSPYFYCMNLRWFLRIYPNGHLSKGWTSIYLRRSGTGPPKSVRYAFSIREIGGDEKYTFDLGESQKFSEERPSWGATNFARVSDLLSRKSQGALSDALTVVCTVWSDEPLFTEDDRLVSCESQTEDLPDRSSREEGLADFDTKGVVILQNHFQNLLLESNDHDVTLKVKDQHFRAHKNILRTRSPVFAAMFAHNMAENECGEVCIQDCDPNAFGEFLKYVYVGNLENISPTITTGVYYVADKYDFPDLKEKCVKFLKESLTPNVISDVILLAMKHGEDALLECAMEFFSEHVIETLMTVEWQRFNTSNPILANELNVKAMKISRKNTE